MKKKKWIALAVVGVFGIGIATGSQAEIRHLKNLQPQQMAAERWGTDMVQLTCYFSTEQQESLTDMQDIHEKIEETLSTSATQDGVAYSTIWYDVYSANLGEEKVEGGKKVTKNLDVTLVSENYFRIHNLQLASGAYLTEDSVSTQSVILDTEAAWKLFGSVNIIGEQIIWNNQLLTVAGVVEQPTDFATKKVQAVQSPEMYVLYSDYQIQNAENDTGITDADDAVFDGDSTSTEVPITCYEVVMPEAVEGYGKSVLEDALGNSEDSDSADSTGDTEEDTTLVVQNTNRFSFSHVWDYLKNHTDYIVRTDGIRYPTAENAALILLHTIAMVTVLAGFGWLVVVICGIIAGIGIYRICKKKGNPLKIFQNRKRR